MAYAAALDDARPEYLDTTRPGSVIGHPLFPVCYEWPLAVELREAMPPEVVVRSVHATHDVRLSRPVRAGDRLATTATVSAAVPRTPGAYVVTRLETVDAAGRHVSTTEYGSIYRGVECEPGGSAPESATPAPTRPKPDWSVRLPVPAGLAHTYTECARIWNPIHTDKAVAQAAGLPDIILHGTATLALAVSAALGRPTAGSVEAVSRVTCRFTGMVRLPSEITVEGWDEPDADGRGIGFHVLSADGRPALSHGRLVMRDGANAR
jgi:acyl dehydratase